MRQTGLTINDDRHCSGNHITQAKLVHATDENPEKIRFWHKGKFPVVCFELPPRSNPDCELANQLPSVVAQNSKDPALFSVSGQESLAEGYVFVQGACFVNIVDLVCLVCFVYLVYLVDFVNIVYFVDLVCFVGFVEMSNQLGSFRDPWTTGGPVLTLRLPSGPRAIRRTITHITV